MNRFFHNAYIILKPLALFLFPMRIVGLENVPEGPALLCPNHANAFDPVLVSVAMPNDSGLRFMAKEELFARKAVAWFIGKLGAFPVKRGGNDLSAMKTAMKCLQDGGKLLVFPEGTRVERHGQVEAKGGAAMIAIRSGVKMQPVYIMPNKRPFRRSKIVFGPAYAPVYTGRKGTAEEYQANVEEVMRQVKELGERV